MTGRPGVAGGIASAWSLARGEPSWQDRMDLSANAVFGSFLAIPLALPAIVLSSEVARRTALTLPGVDAALYGSAVIAGVFGVLGALLSWGVSLFVLVSLVRRTADGWRVSPLIIGYNWSRLVADLILGLGAAAAVATGVLGIALAAGAVSQGIRIYLDVGVIRHAVGITLGQAIGAYLVVLLARLVVVILLSVPQGLLTGAAGT